MKNDSKFLLFLFKYFKHLIHLIVTLKNNAFRIKTMKAGIRQGYLHSGFIHPNMWFMQMSSLIHYIFVSFLKWLSLKGYSSTVIVD